ncbi:hypothetical protein IFHNHDMJ_00390 [Synechococcus sp. CBW1107]|nr:hypothetical protein IFHNHDMJ_00390 [Synechococcus sp. CBW1107]
MGFRAIGPLPLHPYGKPLLIGKGVGIGSELSVVGDAGCPARLALLSSELEGLSPAQLSA